MSTPAEAPKLEPLRKAAEIAVARLPGVAKAIVALTAERAPQRQPGPRAQQAGELRAGIPGIRHMIAVASGKGGVGKSTTAVNLALGLQALGFKVAMLDADVYGPSLPKLAWHFRPAARRPKAPTRKCCPWRITASRSCRWAFSSTKAPPMIWRGPMVMSALMQMLRDVAWGEIDVMVVDMPPGTGDAQLTLAQQTPLSGAVIVSTPQDLGADRCPQGPQHVSAR